MKYVIITAVGFQMRGSEAAVYDTQEEAMEHASPGDQIVPIYETQDENVIPFR